MEKKYKLEVSMEELLTLRVALSDRQELNKMMAERTEKIKDKKYTEMLEDDIRRVDTLKKRAQEKIDEILRKR